MRSIFIVPLLIILSSFIMLSGCSTYTAGLKPVYPLDNQVVEDLSPTISWEDMSGAGSKYDLIVYEKVEDSDVLAYGGGGVTDGKKVFYQENIDGTEMKLENVIKPNRTYYWSVRERYGNNVSDWSQAETHVFTGVSYHRRAKYFEFRSPAAPVEE